MQDCEFWSGANDLSGTNITSVATLKNNLFWRSSLFASNTSSQASLFLTNNLFWRTSVTLNQPSNIVWSACDNDFDTCTITNSTLTNGYNAYLHCTGRLNPTNAYDKVYIGSPYHQSGPLGDFYQPTNSALINAGSTTADQVGLYHFTTQTNQTVEGTSTVDIGYHYVAVDANGNPIDTDGDGIPDYIEDANGNGIYDSGENNWLFAAPFRGVNDWVNAIAVDNNGNVYVGGYFNVAGNTNANSIAMWNPASKIWSPLYQYPGVYGDVEGVDGVVNAIAIDSSNNVFVGGSFESPNGSFNIAYWNPTNLTWSSMGNGNPNDPYFSGVYGPVEDDCGTFGGAVNGICLSGNNVYVVGVFASMNGRPCIFPSSNIAATNIAVWNSTSNAWSIDTSLPSNIGILNTIANTGTNFYVGGRGGFAKGQLSGGIITWQVISTNNGYGGECRAIAITPNNGVIFGGQFLHGVDAYGVLEWTSGTNLIVLPNSDYIMPTYVNALCLAGTNLFIGGDFEVQTTGVGPPWAVGVVGYSLTTSNYFALGQGSPVGAFGEVNALAVWPSGSSATKCICGWCV